jgi:hypothetical protein
MTDTLREVRLPDDLCRRAEEQFRERFGNVEELLVYVLQELVRDDAVRMDEDEAQMIEKRLRDLGYM